MPISGGGISASASSLCFLVPRYQFASRTLGVGGIGGQYRTFPIHPRPPPIDEGHEPLIGPAQLAVLPFEHPFLIPVLASERRPAPSWQQTSARSLRCGRRFACRNTKRVASRGIAGLDWREQWRSAVRQRGSPCPPRGVDISAVSPPACGLVPACGADGRAHHSRGRPTCCWQMEPPRGPGVPPSSSPPPTNKESRAAAGAS